MNCAVCGTPRSENEDSCLFCGAKFPELNMEQEDKNYTTKDVVSFGVEKNDDDFDLDGFLQKDTDSDAFIKDIETEDFKIEELNTVNDEEFTIEKAETEEKSENVEVNDFDFSVADLSEIENMLNDEEFTIEEAETEEESETVEVEDFDFSVADEFFDIEELESIEEVVIEEGFKLEKEELVEIEDDVLTSEESLEVEDFNLTSEELAELKDFNMDNVELSETDKIDLEPEKTVEIETSDLIEEETTSEEDTSLSQEELFTEEELEFLNDRVEEVSQITVEPTVESLIEEGSNDIDNDFDLSLEDLENIEKGLFGDESASETLSMLEEALLSGEDVTSINVKEAIVGQNNKVEEVEQEEFSVSEAIVKAVSDHSQGEKDGLVSFEMFEKVSNALKAKEKGEILDYITPSIDDRSDDQILYEVQATVNVLMNDQISHSENLNEELLELEQMLIASSKENEPRVIEDVEDIEDLELVDVEDIDDDDNLVKQSEDDKIQQGIDDLVKNFRDAKDNTDETQEDLEKIDSEDTEIQDSEKEVVKQEETETVQEAVETIVEEPEQAVEDSAVPSNDDIEADDEDLDELERIDREILKAKQMKDEAEERAAQMEEIDTALKELDSLISDVIGDLVDIDPKSKDDEINEGPADVDNKPFVQEKRLYDKELVKEYEALRLDLELFFPGTQALDSLSSDIDELLKEDDISDILEIMESDEGMDFEGFDFEELTDRDISDALIDLREAQDPLEKKRLEEKRKKKIARRKKIKSIVTLGNRVKAYDTALLIVCLITAVTLGFAWVSTVRTQNLTVNMQTKSEQEEIADALWDGLYDIAIKFDNIQVSLEGYTKGEVDTNKVTFELSNLIDETIITRQNFQSVDLPTYSEYKYKIDEFLAKRMILAEEVLEDVSEGKTSSEAITEFLSLETDMSTFEDTKEAFYKQLNLSN